MKKQQIEQLRQDLYKEIDQCDDLSHNKVIESSFNLDKTILKYYENNSDKASGNNHQKPSEDKCDDKATVCND